MIGDSSFVLPLKNAPRLGLLAPKLEVLAYSTRDAAVSRPAVRQTLNFGVLLAADFPRATYVANGVRSTAALPAFVAVRPGWVCHQENPGPCRKLYFTYDRALLPRFAGLAESPAHALHPLPASRTLFALIEEILRAGRDYSRPGDADRIDLLCQRLLTEILLGNRPAADRPSPERLRITDTARFLAEHYAEPLDIASLIRQSGLPERTFNRRWRERYAQSPHSFLLQKRIDAACGLLSDTGDKIGNIAAAVGFSDPFYFARIFRKYTGLSPSQYRQQQG